MISVITSVYKKEVFENLKKNLTYTTGVPFELISIDNSKGAMGLCEVYNKGAERAQYGILCFAHEDILIRTQQWGQKVKDIFEEHTDLGLLGVAGSSYKPYTPSGWSFPTALSTTLYANYIQSMHGSPAESYECYFNPDDEKLSNVVSVDGMWLCTRKTIFQEIQFDEATFKRFHCYDVDFSLAVYQKYRVAITFEIVVEHFSHGSFQAEWAQETLKLHKKWEKYLPVNLAELDAKTQKQEELGAFNFILQKFIFLRLPIHKLMYFVWSRKLLSIIGIKTFIRLHQKTIKDKAAVLLK